MSGEVLTEIRYPFPNSNGPTFEVWISNAILHWMIGVVSYLCWY